MSKRPAASGPSCRYMSTTPWRSSCTRVSTSEQIGATVTLRLDRLPQVEQPEPVLGFRPFSVQHWQPLYELAASQLNGQAQWWRSVRRADFDMPLDQQAMEWFWRVGRRSVYRLHPDIAALRGGSCPLRPALERRARDGSVGEAGAVRAIPKRCWRSGRWLLCGSTRAPVTINLSRDHSAGLEALEAFGFRPQQTLITMRRRIKA